MYNAWMIILGGDDHIYTDGSDDNPCLLLSFLIQFAIVSYEIFQYV